MLNLIGTKFSVRMNKMQGERHLMKNQIGIKEEADLGYLVFTLLCNEKPLFESELDCDWFYSYCSSL